MNYSIIKELGRGGMATVYLAEDKKFQTHVALKVLNKDLAHNENIRKRFLAEARNMYKMSHPNIIKVTDLIDEGDTVAFVMEHIDGETLKEYLERKGKLSDDEIRNIFSQMLEAVGYVHEQGLIHRDIKPSNFMIDKKGKVKLLDFGIAKNTDSSSAEYTQTGTGMQMGTPMYMSPEQITETKSVTAQSDIYSLGVVLWQLVTGERPYNTATLSNFQLQTKMVNEPLALTGSAFDAVIKKATEKEVTNRYANAAAFLSAVQSKQEHGEKTIVNTVEEKTVITNHEKTVFVEQETPQKEIISADDNNVTEKKVINDSKTESPKTVQNPETGKKNNNVLIFSVIGGVVLVLILLFVFYPFGTVLQSTADAKSSLDIEMVDVAGGTFTMGCTAEQGADCGTDEKPAHQVTLSDYKIGKYEVTQAQWKAVMGNNPSNFSDCDKCPVESVSWNDIQDFISRLNAKTGKSYRLPTEAEWEFAARGGNNSNKSKYSGSKTLDEVAWYDGTSGSKTHEVGTKAANELGIYDMSGNVWEWCQDWYGDYDASSKTNPKGASSGGSRVLRGGGWNSFPQLCRVSFRSFNGPDYRDFSDGFRLVLAP